MRRIIRDNNRLRASKSTFVLFRKLEHKRFLSSQQRKCFEDKQKRAGQGSTAFGGEESEQVTIDKGTKQSESQADDISNVMPPKKIKTGPKISRQNSQRHMIDIGDKNRYYMKAGLFKDKSEAHQRNSLSRGERCSQTSHNNSRPMLKHQSALHRIAKTNVTIDTSSPINDARERPLPSAPRSNNSFLV
jgi:hypothetical protein